MMKGDLMYQSAVFAVCEDVHGVDRRHPVFFPKPRRIGQLAGSGDAFRTLRWHPSYQAEPCESKAGAELMDIFLAKEEDPNQLASSSPPFFRGSPPVRSANPVVHDARFGEPRPPPAVGPFSPDPVSPSVKGCAPSKFGLKPAAVRVEGFNCDRSSRSISAFA